MISTQFQMTENSSSKSTTGSKLSISLTRPFIRISKWRKWALLLVRSLIYSDSSRQLMVWIKLMLTQWWAIPCKCSKRWWCKILTIRVRWCTCNKWWWTPLSHRTSTCKWWLVDTLLNRLRLCSSNTWPMASRIKLNSSDTTLWCRQLRLRIWCNRIVFMFRRLQRLHGLPKHLQALTRLLSSLNRNLNHSLRKRKTMTTTSMMRKMPTTFPQNNNKKCEFSLRRGRDAP